MVRPGFCGALARTSVSASRRRRDDAYRFLQMPRASQKGLRGGYCAHKSHEYTVRYQNMSFTNGQKDNKALTTSRGASPNYDTFVLEKNIFSNIFEKDIKRVFIYKKAERLAKAIHLITPAFLASPSLRNKIDGIAVGLVDAAIEPPASAKGALSKELLALSSVLSIARSGGLLSAMNADIIVKEAHALLEELASYEEPHLFLGEAPSLSDIAKRARREKKGAPLEKARVLQSRAEASVREDEIREKQVKTDEERNSRKETILSVIQSKGQATIKDISGALRGVSEKTVQRELQALTSSGAVRKSGERRWSKYSLV